MYAHKSIKRFSLEGEIYDDSHIYRLKDQYITMIINSMKVDGYVPRYDIDTDWTISYNGKTFDFKVSVYGIYVGKKKAKDFDGVDKNKAVLGKGKSFEKMQQVSEK